MSRNYKKFFLLWLASLISATGSGMTSFALGIYIYQQTGKSSMAGLLLLLGFLPGLLLSPFAGVLADRYDRRLLMMAGDGLSITGLLTILGSTIALHGNFLIWGIGLGVAISSIFSSLVEPAFRATISDLLEKDEYSKASGMTQLISSARYLLSPILAGILLDLAGIGWILLLDILTIVLTLPVTYYVRREMKPSKNLAPSYFREDLRIGFSMIYETKGIWLLVLFGVLVSFCLGTIQTLITPMVLSFSDEAFLGFATTFSACGMLAGGIFLGNVKIRRNFAQILGISLLLTGCFMIGFAARENKFSICLFGFLLFSALPFANASIDYLVRIHIPQDHQGKAWGLIGIISQMGYILAYASIGTIADRIAKPLLISGGAFSQSLGILLGVGEGRGAALVIILAGALLSISSIFLTRKKEIRNLEKSSILKSA